MKAYITIFSFLFLSTVGIQHSFAQNKEKKFVSNTEKEVTVEQRIKQDVFEMGQVLNLTAEQKEELQTLFTEIDEKKNLIVQNNKNADNRKSEFLKVEEAKTQRLKQILSEEQYNQYLKML